MSCFPDLTIGGLPRARYLAFCAFLRSSHFQPRDEEQEHGGSERPDGRAHHVRSSNAWWRFWDWLRGK
jgi:hypothetical protein